MDDPFPSLSSEGSDQNVDTDSLLPLVYADLRRIAAGMLAQERSGQTWQPTALVHEAYMRLVGGKSPVEWTSRAHFFGAAAEAMRRLLIENARKKKRQKRGGDCNRVEFDLEQIASSMTSDRLLELDDAIERFELAFPDKAPIVKLRFYAGLTNDEAAAVLGVSTATAQRYWTFARVWLYSELTENSEET